MTSENIRPGDWVAAVRTMRFGTRRGVRAATIRAVALTFASYADYDDGTRIFPGVALLAVHSEVDYRTARTVIAVLRDDLELITLVKGGRRRGHSDEYRLTMPDDIVDRIEILNPSQVELAVEQIRGRHRRAEAPSTGVSDTRTSMILTSGTGVIGTRTRSPQPVDNSSVRVSQVPVPEWAAQDRTGVAGTPTQDRTGVALSQYGCRSVPPPNHYRHTSTTDPTLNEEIRTEVEVVGRSGQDPESHDPESTPAWDHPTPPTTRPERAVGRARVPGNVVPFRPRTA